MIQIITYSEDTKFKGENITNTTFTSPYSLDAYEVNIIDFSDEKMWTLRTSTSRSFDNYKTLKALGDIIKNSNKTKILVLLPQDLIIHNKKHEDEPRLRSDVNCIYNYLFDAVDNDWSKKISLLYENTFTTFDGTKFLAAFHCISDSLEIKREIVSDQSEKVVVFSLNNVYFSTLKIQNLEELYLLLFRLDFVQKKTEFPEWIDDVLMFDDIEQRRIIEISNAIIKQQEVKIKNAQQQLDKNMELKSILFTTGDELVSVVFEILTDMLGCDLTDFTDRKKEDFLFELDGYTFVGEIKGVNSSVKNQNISQLDVHVQGYLDDNPSVDPSKIIALLIINHQKNKSPKEREPVHEDQIKLARRNQSLIVESITLLKLYEKYKCGGITRDECISLFNQNKGILIIP